MKKFIICLFIFSLFTSVFGCVACDLQNGCSNKIDITEGVLYNLSNDGSYAEVIGYEGTSKKIVIAEEFEGQPVKFICDNAFRNNHITSIVISNNIETIGEEAFYGCSSLKKVILGKKVRTIGRGAFNGCRNIENIKIPDSVEIIGDEVFSLCVSLESVTLGNNLKFIGNKAFFNCEELEKITLPYNLTTIGYDAFYFCKSLEDVEFENISGWQVDNYGVAEEFLSDTSTAASFLLHHNVHKTWIRMDS